MEPIGYPLSLDDQRTYSPGFDGVVHVWDIDKTYLSTHFSSMRGLARIPIEFAVDKRAIPGMPEVLRALRQGPGPDFACTPLYFVSASPPQLRRVIERKMLLDGVDHDGITFKDWAGTLLRLRPGRLKEQVGFKLVALLAGRRSRPRSREYLFGDDSETDAEAFHLYARILSGELDRGEVEPALEAAGVRSDDRRIVLRLLDGLGRPLGRVERAFIHLEKRTPPDRLSHLAPLVIPVRGAAQLALALYELGLVPTKLVMPACLAGVAPPSQYGNLEELLQDALERGLLSRAKLQTLDLRHPSGQELIPSA